MQNISKYFGVIILYIPFVIKLLLSHVETRFVAFAGVHLHFGHSDPHISVKQRTRHRVLYRTVMDFKNKPPFHKYISIFSMVNFFHLQDKDNF